MNIYVDGEELDPNLYKVILKLRKERLVILEDQIKNIKTTREQIQALGGKASLMEIRAHLVRKMKSLKRTKGKEFLVSVEELDTVGQLPSDIISNILKEVNEQEN